MLRWAEKRKPWRTLMADGNPADLIDVNKLLEHDYEEQRDRLLSPDEIRELHDIFARLERDYGALPPARNIPASARSIHACSVPSGSA